MKPPFLRCSICRHRFARADRVIRPSYALPEVCRWCRGRFLELGMPDPTQETLPLVDSARSV